MEVCSFSDDDGWAHKCFHPLKRSQEKFHPVSRGV